MRAGKVVKIGVLGLVALAVVGVALLRSINVNEYKGLLTKRVEQFTGRKLSIAGSLELAFSFNPSIVANGIKLANASWGTQPALLTAKRFKAELELFPLLLGELRIKQVVIINPTISLETNAKGYGNWDLAGGKRKQGEASQGGTKLPVLEINEVDIRNAHITYRSAASGQTTALDIDSLALRSKGLYQPITIDSSIGYRKNPVKISGTLGSYAKLTANESWPVDLTADSGKVHARIQGTVGRPLEAQDIQLALTADAPSGKALDRFFGASLPAVGPVSLTAAIGSKPGELTFTDVHARIDKTEITGRAHLSLGGAQPTVDADLGSSLIDLRGLPEQKDDGSGPIFSSKPLPVAALRGMSGTVKLRVDTLKLRSMLLSDIEATAHLKDGRLKLDPIRARMADGTVTGSAVLDASRDTPSLQLRLNAKHLEPGEIGKLRGVISGAPTDINVNVKGLGDSPKAIAASLNGSVRMVAGRGRIHNTELNLAGTDVLSETMTLVNPFAKKDPESSLECAVVNLHFHDGVARTDKGLAMETNKMNAIGSGTIDLGTEKLDLGMRVDTRQGLGISLGEFAHAVRIGGTLSHPEPKADAAGIVREGGTIGAAIATGGLSLLAQKLFDKATSDTHPCATALGRAPAPAANQGSAQAAPAKSSSSSAPTQQQGEGGVRGFLNKIFGD